MESLNLFTSKCPPRMAARGQLHVSDFGLVRKLGAGYASKVYLVQEKSTGMTMALKAYAKSELQELNRKQVVREIQLHSALMNEPDLDQGLVQLYAAFDDDQFIYLILEYCEGGDLFRERHRRGCFTENEAVLLVSQLVATLATLHRLSIIHRDLKPENILLTTNPTTGELCAKVTDLGLSICTEVERPTTRLGTVAFMSPELVDPKQAAAGYGPEVDVWALGLITVELLVGKNLFEKDTPESTMRAVLKGLGAAELPRGFNELSPEARHFVSSCLNKNPLHRPTMADLQDHMWLRKHRMLGTRFATRSHRRSLEVLNKAGSRSPPLGAKHGSPTQEAPKAIGRAASLPRNIGTLLAHAVLSGNLQGSNAGGAALTTHLLCPSPAPSTAAAMRRGSVEIQQSWARRPVAEVKMGTEFDLPKLHPASHVAMEADTAPQVSMAFPTLPAGVAAALVKNANSHSNSPDHRRDKDSNGHGQPAPHSSILTRSSQGTNRSSVKLHSVSDESDMAHRHVGNHRAAHPRAVPTGGAILLPTVLSTSTAVGAHSHGHDSPNPYDMHKTDNHSANGRDPSSPRYASLDTRRASAQQHGGGGAGSHGGASTESDPATPYLGKAATVPSLRFQKGARGDAAAAKRSQGLKAFFQKAFGKGGRGSVMPEATIANNHEQMA